MRRRSGKIRIVNWTYHNGICGGPVYVVLFDDMDEENTRKVGVLFQEPHHCAVLDVRKLAAGTIAVSMKSRRGDGFEDLLRAALRLPPLA